MPLIMGAMPIYCYEVIDTGEYFEVEHSSDGPFLTEHPETGQKVQRVYTTPNLGGRFSGDYNKNILSNKNLEKSGFTKYERDPLTQRYNRVAGKFGPAQLRPKG